MRSARRQHTEAAIDFEMAQAFMSRVMGDLGGALTGLLCMIGDRLGLFRALAEGPATSEQLAARTKLHERYVREWLAALACAGYVDVDAQGSFSLPAERALVLASERSPMFLGGGFQQLMGLTRPLEQLLEAFQMGGGVAQESYGEDLLSGMERMSATWFENLLVEHWLPAAGEVVQKLEDGATLADVGCGSGRAILRLAQAYPRSHFVGYDCFGPVLVRARARAEAAGVSDRVRFEQLAVEDGLPERYDLITAFDSLHDMTDPAGALRAMHAALDDAGVLLLMEMNCSEHLQDNVGLSGTILFATSVLYNTPVTLARGRAALGTMALPEATVRELCAAAGFASVRRLPIMNPFNILYEILP
jgi:2-polyprenyl-3-methyl-5-hydroxy-6-metoxy-1,4-benzoquinol methylase